MKWSTVPVSLFSRMFKVLHNKKKLWRVAVKVTGHVCSWVKKHSFAANGKSWDRFPSGLFDKVERLVQKESRLPSGKLLGPASWLSGALTP